MLKGWSNIIKRSAVLTAGAWEKALTRTEHAASAASNVISQRPVKALMLSLAPSELQKSGFSSAPRLNASPALGHDARLPHNYGQSVTAGRMIASD